MATACTPTSAGVLHPDHAGHGYATHAVRELLRLSCAELGLRRVTANCFADITASWRLMERVGMRRGQRTRFTRRMAPAPSTAHAPATAYSTP